MRLRCRRDVDLVDAVDDAVAGQDVRGGDARAVDGELVAAQLDRCRLPVDSAGGIPSAHVDRGPAAIDQVIVHKRGEFFLVLGLQQAVHRAAGEFAESFVSGGEHGVLGGAGQYAVQAGLVDGVREDGERLVVLQRADQVLLGAGVVAVLHFHGGVLRFGSLGIPWAAGGRSLGVAPGVGLNAESGMKGAAE